MSEEKKYSSSSVIRRCHKCGHRSSECGVFSVPSQFWTSSEITTLINKTVCNLCAKNIMSQCIKMGKIVKKCEKCKKEFEGEFWQKQCIDCFKKSKDKAKLILSAKEEEEEEEEE